MKRLLAVATLALVLAGCGGPEVTRGEVVDLGHRAAYSTTVFVMVGKVPVPSTTHHPERWWVVLEDCDHPDREPGGPCPREDHRISRGVWESLRIGDGFDVTEGRFSR